MARNAEMAAGIRQVSELKMTGHEQLLDPGDTIVSKTDPTGRITYVNRVFTDISGFSEEEMLGAPHSVIRHPDMPRVVFKLLWDAISSGNEIFAYVVNRCKNGDHYWVLAHVTPSYAPDGSLLGYHSSRRAPRPEALAIIKPLYAKLRDIEEDGGRKEGLIQSEAALKKVLADKEISYAEFILTL
jgi:PAS domain S-box-containing protein